ncbi:hypothetical protein [Priestia megaterium]|uniref:hypothetical protein n=1 Tax=Priestia megaterium TaxID=1404 RepID=UPI00076254A6|nr:hypothetical protein [Priestia megaterium]KWU61397.1 hypothetical protein AWX17_18475 [Priestia megaterium]
MLFHIEYSILIITLYFPYNFNFIISDDMFGAIVANYYEDAADAIVPMVYMDFADAIAAMCYEDNDGAIVPMTRMGVGDATAASYYEDVADAIVPMAHMMSVRIA